MLNIHIEMLLKSLFLIYFRLPQPDYCPEIVYKTLMFPCWDLEPYARPNFTHIIKVIEDLLEEYKECVQFNENYQSISNNFMY